MRDVRLGWGGGEEFEGLVQMKGVLIGVCYSGGLGIGFVDRVVERREGGKELNEYYRVINFM